MSTLPKCIILYFTSSIKFYINKYQSLFCTIQFLNNVLFMQLHETSYFISFAMFYEIRSMRLLANFFIIIKTCFE